jgi:hypothetical protein
MRIIPVQPRPEDLDEQIDRRPAAPSASQTSRRVTFGRHLPPSRRTFGRNLPSRTTFGWKRP